MTDKCGHCPLASEDRHCPGQYNPRACALPAERILASKGPGLVERAANFVTAVAGHVAAGMPTASAEVKAARLAICGGCEHYSEGVCLVCSCNLDWKAGWADMACPIGKWAAVVNEPPADRSEPYKTGN